MVCSTKGRRRASKAQITATKGNRGHASTTIVRGRMAHEETRLRETNWRKPSRTCRRRKYRETRDIFNTVSNATKVPNTPFSGGYKDWLRF